MTDTHYLHPSQFQFPDHSNLKHNMTFENINTERKQLFDTTIVNNLKAQKSYPLTKNDDDLSCSNTRHLFKNISETPLTLLFFSDHNINNIQNLVKMQVYQKINHVISNQSTIEIEIAMRSIYLTYSEHPLLFTDNMSPETIAHLKTQYTEEVARLNNIVINTITPTICTQIQQYLDYLRDASSGLRTIPRAVNTSIAGERQYRSITNVLTGNSL